MKRFFSFLFILTVTISVGNAFAQRSVGGTQVDLDDNAGNHIFLTTLGSSFGVNALGLAPNVGALLDLSSTTKGLLLPRMTAGQEAGVSAIGGMTLYNSTSHTIDFYNGVTWMNVNGGWSLGGNSGTNPALNYLGTSDIQDLVIRTAATERMRILSGGNVLISSTAGTALNIVGPAATSISAAGAIFTSAAISGGSLTTGGNLAVTGSSKLGSTATPIQGIYKIVVGDFAFNMPANAGGTQSFFGLFGGAGFSPLPAVGDAIIVTADPGVFPLGLTWSATFVGSDGFQINILNGTGAAVAMGVGNFYVTAIKY